MIYEDGCWHREFDGWHTEFEQEFKMDVFKRSPTQIKFSKHIIDEVKNGKFSKNFDLSKITIDLLTYAYLFEVETEAHKIIKYVCRVQYDEDIELSVVIIPKENIFIKTAWVNKKDDKSIPR